MADLAARVALLSTSDTDLLSARASGMSYTWSNPSRASDAELRAATDGASLVVVRLLGSPHDLWPGLSTVREAGTPLVILGGEQQPNAELMELSTVPIGVAAQAHRYLAEGGPANLAQLHAFLSDTVLLTGEGFEPPTAIPAWGCAARPAAAAPAASGARVGVLYYRAHEASGNSGFAHALADAIDATGEAVGIPVFAGSLRSAPTELYDALAGLDALVVTVLAAGGSVPANASAGGDDEAWDVERMAALDIPVLQGLCLTSSRADWEASSEGLTPLDSASQIAIPEFDGRLITVPFSFKEIDADGLPRYVADPERCRRVARIAAVRVLTGADPKAYVGDSTSPDAVRTRTLTEETARVFRARVVNPRWIAAMRRHGYKGAFELAATVDYLFGFDATAGVVQDWMYDKLAREYVLDEASQDFLRRANPWALRGIVERLHEAAERGLWAEPDPAVLAAMQVIYLEVEGDLEDRGE